MVKGLAELTIEIYLVQYLVYYAMPPMSFPVNFIVTTGAVLFFAVFIHLIGGNMVKRSTMKW